MAAVMLVPLALAADVLTLCGNLCESGAQALKSMIWRNR